MKFNKLFALGVSFIATSRGAEMEITGEPEKANREAEALELYSAVSSSKLEAKYKGFLQLSGFKVDHKPLRYLQQNFGASWIEYNFYPTDASVFDRLFEAGLQYAWALFKQGDQASFENALNKLILFNNLDQPLSTENITTVNYLKLYIIYHYMIAVLCNKDRFSDENKRKVQTLKNSGVKIYNRLAETAECRFNKDLEFSISCIGTAMVTQSFLYRIEAYYSFLKNDSGLDVFLPQPTNEHGAPLATSGSKAEDEVKVVLEKSAEEDRSILADLLQKHLKKFGEQKYNKLFAGVRRYLTAINSIEKEVVLSLKTGEPCLPAELEKIIFEYADPILKQKLYADYNKLDPLFTNIIKEYRTKQKASAHTMSQILSPDEMDKLINGEVPQLEKEVEPDDRSYSTSREPIPGDTSSENIEALISLYDRSYEENDRLIEAIAQQQQQLNAHIPPVEIRLTLKTIPKFLEPGLVNESIVFLQGLLKDRKTEFEANPGSEALKVAVLQAGLSLGYEHLKEHTFEAYAKAISELKGLPKVIHVAAERSMLSLYIYYHQLLKEFQGAERFSARAIENVDMLIKLCKDYYNKLTNHPGINTKPTLHYSIAGLGTGFLTVQYIYNLRSYYNLLANCPELIQKVRENDKDIKSLEEYIQEACATSPDSSCDNKPEISLAIVRSNFSKCREYFLHHIQRLRDVFGKHNQWINLERIRKFVAEGKDSEQNIIKALEEGRCVLPPYFLAYPFQFLEENVRHKCEKEAALKEVLKKEIMLFATNTRSESDIDPTLSVDELVAAIGGERAQPKAKKRKNKSRRKKGGGGQEKKQTVSLSSTAAKPKKTDNKEPGKRRAWNVEASTGPGELQGEWTPVGKSGKTKAPAKGIFEVPVEKPAPPMQKKETLTLPSPSVTDTDASSQSVGSSRGRTPSDESFSPMDDAASFGAPDTPELGSQPSPTLSAVSSDEVLEKANTPNKPSSFASSHTSETEQPEKPDSPVTPEASPSSVSSKVALANYADAPAFVPSAPKPRYATTPRYVKKIWKPVDAARPTEEPVVAAENEDKGREVYERLRQKAQEDRSSWACIELGNMWAQGLVGAAGKQPDTAMHWFIEGIWLEKDLATRKRLQGQVTNYIQLQRWPRFYKDKYLGEVYLGPQHYQ